MLLAPRIYSPTDSEQPQISAFIRGCSESVGNLSARCFAVAFALTPSLSRRETERGAAARVNLDCPPRSTRPRDPDATNAEGSVKKTARLIALPLSAGERWGEGERPQNWIHRAPTTVKLFSPTDSEQPQISSSIRGRSESVGNFFIPAFGELT